MKINFLLATLFLFTSLYSSAQKLPTDKESLLTSIGGSYIKNKKSDISELNVALASNYFILNNFFTGFSFSMMTTKGNGITERLRSIGPNLGFTLRKKWSNPLRDSWFTFLQVNIYWKWKTKLILGCCSI
jgi:hypothetical protein